MNIFLVDRDPTACAQALDDLRLNKMILETAQLLCVAYRYYWPHLAADLEDLLYKPTHQNHPVAVWLRQDINNYVWTVVLFNELHIEKIKRTGVHHASHWRLFNTLYKPVGDADLASVLDGVQFTFNCSNTEPSTGNVYFDYRMCLVKKWKADVEARRHPRWSKRTMPSWAMLYQDNSLPGERRGGSHDSQA